MSKNTFFSILLLLLITMQIVQTGLIIQPNQTNDIITDQSNEPIVNNNSTIVPRNTINNQTLANQPLQNLQKTAVSSTSSTSSVNTNSQTVRVDYTNYVAKSNQNWQVDYNTASDSYNSSSSNSYNSYVTTTQNSNGINQYQVPVNPVGTNTVVHNASGTEFIGSSASYQSYSTNQSEYFRDQLGTPMTFDSGVQGWANYGGSTVSQTDGQLKTVSGSAYLGVYKILPSETSKNVYTNVSFDLYCTTAVTMRIVTLFEGVTTYGYYYKDFSCTTTLTNYNYAFSSFTAVASRESILFNYLIIEPSSGGSTYYLDNIKLLGSQDYAQQSSSIHNPWDWEDSKEYSYNVLGNITDFTDGSKEGITTDDTFTNAGSQYGKLVTSGTTSYIDKASVSITASTYKYFAMEFNTSATVTNITVYDSGANIICSSIAGWSASTWSLFSCTANPTYWTGTETEYKVVFTVATGSTLFINNLFWYDSSLGNLDDWDVPSNMYQYVDPTGYLVDRVIANSATTAIRTDTGKSIDTSIFKYVTIRIKADQSTSRYFAFNFDTSSSSNYALTTSFQTFTYKISALASWTGTANYLRLYFYSNTATATTFKDAVFTIDYLLLTADKDTTTVYGLPTDRTSYLYFQDLTASTTTQTIYTTAYSSYQGNGQFIHQVTVHPQGNSVTIYNSTGWIFSSASNYYTSVIVSSNNVIIKGLPINVDSSIIFTSDQSQNAYSLVKNQIIVPSSTNLNCTINYLGYCSYETSLTLNFGQDNGSLIGSYFVNFVYYSKSASSLQLSFYNDSFTYNNTLDTLTNTWHSVWFYISTDKYYSGLSFILIPTGTIYFAYADIYTINISITNSPTSGNLLFSGGSSYLTDYGAIRASNVNISLSIYDSIRVPINTYYDLTDSFGNFEFNVANTLNSTIYYYQIVKVNTYTYPNTIATQNFYENWDSYTSASQIYSNGWSYTATDYSVLDTSHYTSAPNSWGSSSSMAIYRTQNVPTGLYQYNLSADIYTYSVSFYLIPYFDNATKQGWGFAFFPPPSPLGIRFSYVNLASFPGSIFIYTKCGDYSTLTTYNFKVVVDIIDGIPSFSLYENGNLLCSGNKEVYSVSTPYVYSGNTLIYNQGGNTFDNVVTTYENRVDANPYKQINAISQSSISYSVTENNVAYILSQDSSGSNIYAQVYMDNIYQGVYQSNQPIYKLSSSGSHTFSYKLIASDNYIIGGASFVNSTFTGSDNFQVNIGSYSLSDYYVNLYASATKDYNYYVYENNTLKGSGTGISTGTFIQSSKNLATGILVNLAYKFVNSTNIIWFNTTYSNPNTNVFYLTSYNVSLLSTITIQWATSLAGAVVDIYQDGSQVVIADTSSPSTFTKSTSSGDHVVTLIWSKTGYANILQTFTYYVAPTTDFQVSVGSYSLSDYYVNLYASATRDYSYSIYENNSLKGSGSGLASGTFIQSTKNNNPSILVNLAYKFTNGSSTVWFNTTYSNPSNTLFYLSSYNLTLDSTIVITWSTSIGGATLSVWQDSTQVITSATSSPSSFSKSIASGDHIVTLIWSKSGYANIVQTFNYHVDPSTVFSVQIGNFYLSDSYVNIYATATKDFTYTIYENNTLAGSGAGTSQGSIINYARNTNIDSLILVGVKFVNSTDTVWFNSSYTNAAQQALIISITPPIQADNLLQIAVASNYANTKFFINDSLVGGIQGNWVNAGVYAWDVSSAYGTHAINVTARIDLNGDGLYNGTGELANQTITWNYFEQDLIIQNIQFTSSFNKILTLSFTSNYRNANKTYFRVHTYNGTVWSAWFSEDLTNGSYSFSTANLPQNLKYTFYVQIEANITKSTIETQLLNYTYYYIPTSNVVSIVGQNNPPPPLPSSSTTSDTNIAQIKQNQENQNTWLYTLTILAVIGLAVPIILQYGRRGSNVINKQVENVVQEPQKQIPKTDSIKNQFGKLKNKYD